MREGSDGSSSRPSRRPIPIPASSEAINGGTDAGAMPANVSENILAKEAAGFAKEVDAVNQ